MTAAHPVFYVSDGTGITAETIGHSILTQFTGTRFATDRIPFVDTVDKARDVAARIRDTGAAMGLRPVIVSSCVDAELTQALAESGALVLDVFAPFIAPMEQELGLQRMPQVGQAHGIVDFDAYHRRINAMNYALTHDDGMRLDYAEADLILVGVSRAGKTPTCVYLALHYGIRAANYPLTDDDLDSDRLPPKLKPFRRMQPAVQNISRLMPSDSSTRLAISSIEACVVLSTGMRSSWNIASACATSRRQVSSCE